MAINPLRRRNNVAIGGLGSALTKKKRAPIDDPVEIVNQITSKDSPLMRAAATKGRQFANSRGLVNSSMAAGASQTASLEAAVPLAIEKANINANKNRDRKGFKYNSRLAQQKFGFDSNLLGRELGSREKIAGMEIQSRESMQASDQAFRSMMADKAFANTMTLEDKRLAGDLTKMDKQLQSDLTLSDRAFEQKWKLTKEDAANQLALQKNELTSRATLQAADQAFRLALSDKSFQQTMAIEDRQQLGRLQLMEQQLAGDLALSDKAFQSKWDLSRAQAQDDLNLQKNELAGRLIEQANDYKNKKSLQNLSIVAQKDLALLDANTRKELLSMEDSMRTKLEGMKLDSETAAQVGSWATNMQQLYGENFRTIMQNPNLPASERNKLVKDFEQLMGKQFDMTKKIYGVDLSWETGSWGKPPDETPSEPDTGQSQDPANPAPSFDPSNPVSGIDTWPNVYEPDGPG